MRERIAKYEAAESARAAEEADGQRKKAVAMLNALKEMGTVSDEQITNWTSQLNTDLAATSQMVEVAVSCSRAARAAADDKAAALETRMADMRREQELVRMYGSQYAAMDVRRASVKRSAAAVESVTERPAKIAAQDVSGAVAASAMDTGAPGAASLTTRIEPARTGPSDSLYTIGKTTVYGECSAHCHRTGLVKANVGGFEAAAYHPTPSPAQTAGFGLMHVNPDMWSFITTGRCGDPYSYRGDIIKAHRVAASKERGY